MSGYYTDEDVREAECAIGLNGRSTACILCLNRGCACPQHAARAALRAVAPAIVARAKAEALREFADSRVTTQTPARMAEDLRARADEIEATR